MSIEKLKRVMWRVRSTQPGYTRIKRKTLEQAIMRECGTDKQTYKNNRRALIKIDWIRSDGGNHFLLTNKDLAED